MKLMLCFYTTLIYIAIQIITIPESSFRPGEAINKIKYYNGLENSVHKLTILVLMK